MVHVFECSCGATVRAKGAVPGRVGRCPHCGARLEVPGPASPSADSRPAKTKKNPDSEQAAGYDIGPEPPPARAPAPARRGAGGAVSYRERDPESEPIEFALVHAPRRQETRLLGSLLYPLWDSGGLALLALFPPLCLITSIFSFGLFGYVHDGSEAQGMGALTMILPAGCLLALTISSGLRFLEEVLESTTRGEVAHPRWPSWELAEVVPTLFRWAFALLFGLAVGTFLAWSYWRSAAGLPEAARMGYVLLITLGLFGSGAIFWPVPLLAVLLHRDIRAANPFTVLRVYSLGGAKAIAISLIFGCAGVLLVGAIPALYFLPPVGILATIGGVWFYWLMFWYVALVLMRRLGLFYREHARALGWFT